MIKSFRQKADQSNAYETAIFIAHKSGIMEFLKSDTSIEGITRTDNLNALLDGIKEFVEQDEITADEFVAYDRSLSGFLQSVALLTDLDEDTADKDYISLMSVHSAKGLEFPCVYVVGLEENLFPSFMSMGSVEQIEEERRLFYVAVTRAKRFLTLSYANSRYQYGQIRFNDPSRFLEELGDDSFETTHDRRPGASRGFSEPRRLPPLRKLRSTQSQVNVDVASFKPSQASEIETGMEVLHLKFGKGKVVKIDGARDNRVATIEFESIDDPTRRIMLRFAKLQILSGNQD